MFPIVRFLKDTSYRDFTVIKLLIIVFIIDADYEEGPLSESMKTEFLISRSPSEGSVELP